jgi:phosphoserine aminotransferase
MTYRPFFSSGPTVGFKNMKEFTQKLQGRSHRSQEAVELIYNLRSSILKLVGAPDDYEAVFINGSSTAAIESAIWNMVGFKEVDFFIHDVFGKRWFDQCNEQLKVKGKSYTADYCGSPPPLSKRNPENDALFVWNGTTSGVILNDGDWLNCKDDSLNICDATSAIFAVDIPISKFDATMFSFQKALGGEAGIGCIILSPKAIKRIESYNPKWPVPYLYRLKNNDGEILQPLLDGKLNNTTSMYIFEKTIHIFDYIFKNGGMKYLHEKTHENFNVINNFLENSNQWNNVCELNKYKSPVSPCFMSNKLDSWDKVRNFSKKLSEKNQAFDIVNHVGSGIPSLRIWCGPTVESIDIKKILELI